MGGGWSRTVSMALERSNTVDGFWPRSLKVTQNQGPDWEALFVGEQTWVLSPGAGVRENIRTQRWHHCDVIVTRFLIYLTFNIKTILWRWNWMKKNTSTSPCGLHHSYSSGVGPRSRPAAHTHTVGCPAGLHPSRSADDQTRGRPATSWRESPLRTDSTRGEPVRQLGPGQL